MGIVIAGSPHVNLSKLVKIVVFVPESHSALLRKTMAEAGAGKMGKYSFCSFTSKGVGRFKPEKGANPKIGVVGKIESAEEERIETICARDFLGRVIAAIKKVHPYETPAIDVYALEDI